MIEFIKKLLGKSEPEEIITDPMHIKVKEVIDKQIKYICLI